MLAQGTYSKEEIMQELGSKSNKPCNLIRDLKTLGYKAEGNGRKGDNYRIEILELPGKSIKGFAEEHLGIAARFENELAHFLYLLFALDDGFNAERTATSIEWSTYASRNTIYKWMEALVNCGLLIKRDEQPLYYAASPRIILETFEGRADYTYTKKFKRITEEEFRKAMEAEKQVQEKADMPENYFEYAVDEINWLKEQANKATLDRWHAMYKGKVEINKGWAHYDDLMELLSNYDYEEYNHSKWGNFDEDFVKWEKRVAAWDEEKADRRKRAEEKESEIRAAKEEARQERNKNVDEIINRLVNEGKTAEEIIAYLEGERIC